MQNIREEAIKSFLFADDVTLYIENAKKLTTNIIEMTNAFSIVAGYKIYKNNNYISIH